MTTLVPSVMISGTAPQVTALTSGSGTYTVPANAKYLTVRMVGGGGVGGGSGAGGNSGVIIITAYF
jgi:hypothetical protein